MRPHPSDGQLCLLLVALTLAAFWWVGDCDFVDYDDPEYVAENPHVQGGLSWQGLVWAFTTTRNANWHPLTWVSYQADYQLYGLSPQGYHLTNLLFHVVNVVLLFRVLRRMTGAPQPSALVAALFAVHPLHVESVAWVAERKDVLSTFFGLLTLGAYARYAERPGLSRYSWVLLGFALSLMAKPMLVTLPFVLLLLDSWPLRRWRPGGAGGPDLPRPGESAPPGHRFSPAPLPRLVGEKVPLLVLAAACSAVTVVAQERGGALTPLDDCPLGARLGNALIAYVVYLRKTCWPLDLAVFYPHPGARLSPWLAVAAGLVLALITAGTVAARARRPYLLVGWLWFLGTLVPVIGVVQVGSQALADRYTYVPLIGLFLAVAWTTFELGARCPRPLYGAAGALLALLLVCTWAQGRCWKNSFKLWERALRVGPENQVALNNMGMAFFRAGKMPEALDYFRRAAEFNSQDPLVRLNMGAALYWEGRPAEAAEYFRAALEGRPDDSNAHLYLARIFLQQGRVEEATRHYADALRLRPETALEADERLRGLRLKEGEAGD
jgi:hypothetical protein